MSRERRLRRARAPRMDVGDPVQAGAVARLAFDHDDVEDAADELERAMRTGCDAVVRAAALALGVLAPARADATVHALFAALAAEHHLSHRARERRTALLHQCAIAASARRRCELCLRRALDAACAGVEVSLEGLDLGAIARSQEAYAGPDAVDEVLAYLAVELPRRAPEDVHAATRSLGLPERVARRRGAGALALLLALFDDERLDEALRDRIPKALLRRPDGRAALAARLDAPLMRRTVATAAILEGDRAQAWEDLGHRFRADPGWRGAIAARIRSGADPRFVDDAVAVLALDPVPAVRVLAKLAQGRDAAATRAREELEGFLVAVRLRNTPPATKEEAALDGVIRLARATLARIEARAADP